MLSKNILSDFDFSSSVRELLYLLYKEKKITIQELEMLLNPACCAISRVRGLVINLQTQQKITDFQAFLLVDHYMNAYKLAKNIKTETETETETPHTGDSLYDKLQLFQEEAKKMNEILKQNQTIYDVISTRTNQFIYSVWPIPVSPYGGWEITCTAKQ